MRACRVLRHYRRWTAVVGQRIHISVRVQDDDDLRRSRLSLLLLSPLPVCSAVLLPLLSKAPEATDRERAGPSLCRREGEGAREEEYAVAAARAKGALPFAYYAAPAPPTTTTCEKNKPGPSTRAATQKRRGENRKEGASRRGREGGRSNRSGDSDVEEELIPRPPTDSIDNGLSDVVVCSATSVQIE